MAAIFPTAKVSYSPAWKINKGEQKREKHRDLLELQTDWWYFDAFSSSSSSSKVWGQ